MLHLFTHLLPRCILLNNSSKRSKFTGGPDHIPQATFVPGPHFRPTPHPRPRTSISKKKVLEMLLNRGDPETRGKHSALVWG
mmetsp:Transcript_53737/g.95775  ORF Transcript_53737/g.95775 Transcript_53737/m.95775 type:complete len:82 (+) Transcript_53737:582-827(+)